MKNKKYEKYKKKNEINKRRRKWKLKLERKTYYNTKIKKNVCKIQHLIKSAQAYIP